jgi:hypothetical protein
MDTELSPESEALAASFDIVARQDEADQAIGVLRSDVDEVKARLERVGRAAARPALETAATSPEVKGQFLHAEPLGDGQWRLSGLLRGRGGTEAAAQAGHLAGARFVLLDGKATPLDPDKVGAADEIVALGLGDAEPVSAPLANRGLTLRPLTPVHPRAQTLPDGSLALSWIRRARGAWSWLDEVEVPLGEESEAWLVGVGSTDAPTLHWTLAAPALTLSPATAAALSADHAGEPLWVRQVGSFALSPPLLLTTIV